MLANGGVLREGALVLAGVSRGIFEEVSEGRAVGCSVSGMLVGGTWYKVSVMEGSVVVFVGGVVWSEEDVAVEAMFSVGVSE